MHKIVQNRESLDIAFLSAEGEIVRCARGCWTCSSRPIPRSLPKRAQQSGSLVYPTEKEPQSEEVTELDLTKNDEKVQDLPAKPRPDVYLDFQMDGSF